MRRSGSSAQDRSPGCQFEGLCGKISGSRHVWFEDSAGQWRKNSKGGTMSDEMRRDANEEPEVEGHVRVGLTEDPESETEDEVEAHMRASGPRVDARTDARTD